MTAPRLPAPSAWPVMVEVEASDGRMLEGLVHQPSDGRTPTAAVLHVHGRGGNCYSGPGRFLPPLLAAEPIVHLALNMRSHDLAYTRYDIEDSGELRDDAATVGGGYWERLEDGSVDVDAGVRWLREATGVPVVVSGHSAGGFFIGDHSGAGADVAGRVLLSPLTTTKHPLVAWFGGAAGLERATREATAMVEAGEGHLLIPVPRWFFAISAATLLDRLSEQDGRWIDGMNRSLAPVLLVWGEREDRGATWRDAGASLAAPDTRLLELPGTGHSYHGRERELAAAVGGFVADVVSAAS